MSVSDAGPGIAPDAVASLFDPFFTTKREGMGLGLSISRTIVQSHGGRIWVRVADAEGATFRFALPVWRRAGCRKRRQQRSSPGLPARHLSTLQKFMWKFTPIRARRVGEITHARAAAALAVDGQEGAFVPQVVDEQRGLPRVGAEAPAQVADVVRRQLGVEGDAWCRPDMPPRSMSRAEPGGRRARDWRSSRSSAPGRPSA